MELSSLRPASGLQLAAYPPPRQVATSERNIVEELYRSILESIPYPIVFVNLDHEIVYINKRADEVLHKEGMYPNIVGQSIFHCHNDQSKEMILEIVERFRCIIRPMPTSDSEACRPLVPTDVGHLFRWHVVH